MQWIPSTEAQIESGLESGLFKKGHTFDLKRELGTRRRAYNDLAVDMRIFAVDGGVILIGVDEKTAALTPISLKGLKERVDPVAHSRVDEPLDVAVEEGHPRWDPLGGLCRL
jgi:hypothetical protein